MIVPNLQTSLKGPLLELEKIFFNRQLDIEYWLHRHWLLNPAPFYTSVDIRNAGFKVAPVDTNLFPAGFNNLHVDSEPLCLPALEYAILRYCPRAHQVLIIAENHTRNAFYLESLFRLYTLIAQAGFRVRIGSIDPEVKEPRVIDLEGGKSITIFPVIREDYLYVDNDFVPCAIVLNNDLSSGAPNLLKGLDGQHVIPPFELGWHKRTKQGHYKAYQEITESFSSMLGIDPWLVTPMSPDEGVKIDLDSAETTQQLEHEVDVLLQKIQSKYTQYGISKKPYVMMKATSGTYGMGVVAIRSASEVKQLNRKKRNKMKVGKEGVSINEVLLQEGVYSVETVGDGNVSEPVVYMIDHFVVGGFYRIHKNKGADESLNSPGMHFSPLALKEPMVCMNTLASEKNRFYIYGVVARLAAAAAALEITQKA